MSRINMVFNDPRAANIRREAKGQAGDLTFASMVRILVDEALEERRLRRKHEAESA